MLHSPMTLFYETRFISNKNDSYFELFTSPFFLTVPLLKLTKASKLGLVGIYNKNLIVITTHPFVPLIGSSFY